MLNFVIGAAGDENMLNFWLSIWAFATLGLTVLFLLWGSFLTNRGDPPSQ